MHLSSAIHRNLPAFIAICEKNSVEKMFAFGSSISDEFNTDSSDFDLIVEIDESNPVIKGEKLIDLWDNLEQLFSRKIDLLTMNSLKNPYLLKEIESKKIKVYDGTGKKVLI
jgi:predicted nucleotidyltransferase